MDVSEGPPISFWAETVSAIRAGRCDVRLSCIILSATSLPSEKPARQKRAGAFRRLAGW
jgi:hypothetical protein